MVRKSERNKPTKSVEVVATPRKRGRPRKKSESGSEAEPEVVVEKVVQLPTVDEVGEISEPKPEAGPAPEVEAQDHRTRRTRKHHQAPPAVEPAKELQPEKSNDWKEDPGFWGAEEAPPEPELPKEEGTTWKIQSSNGSGGEIQKLKICRQRVANDSTDSSSPAPVKETSSPRRKRNKSHRHIDDSAESGGEISSSNEIKDEIRTVEAASIPVPPEVPAPDASEDSVSVVVEEVEVETETSSQQSRESPGVSQPEENAVEVEEVAVVETVPAVVEVEAEVPASQEVEVNESDNQSQLEDSVAVASILPTETVLDFDESIPVSEEAVKPVEEIVVTQEVEPVKAEEEPKPEDEPKAEEEVKADAPQPEIQGPEDSTEEGKGERHLIGKVRVDSEDALDEIAKKLNERAARFAKTPEVVVRETRLSREAPERRKSEGKEGKENRPASPREEGELTPQPEEKSKKTHTTVIINKKEVVTSQPTRLKRNTDELPPTERKRRILLKSKSKDKVEDPINISSQSLALLVPEVSTITPEQVASFPFDDDELTKLEMDGEETQEEQPKVKKEKNAKKKIDIKAKDVEVRLENDTRQVSKKKTIVFGDDEEDLRQVGPKLPQDPPRVVRKISLVNDEVKKARRSPSPTSGNSPTEVLFITNLVRPFTVPQLRELLARTGTIATNGFYIDKIKSKCYVKYTDVEMAVETRHALNGVRWPVNNPKTLRVEFVEPEEMDEIQKLADDEESPKKADQGDTGGWLSEQAVLKPQRKVTTAVREWDMGKIGAGPLDEKKPKDNWKVEKEPKEQKRRAASPVENKFDPSARKIKKRDNDAPARLLDDLFRKTKATPCIYWLPLTAAQIAVKEEMRKQHMAENERRLAELRKSSDRPKRERERSRERERDRRKK